MVDYKHDRDPVEIAIDALTSNVDSSQRVQELEGALWEVAKAIARVCREVPRSGRLYRYLANAHADALKALEGK